MTANIHPQFLRSAAQSHESWVFGGVGTTASSGTRFDKHSHPLFI